MSAVVPMHVLASAARDAASAIAALPGARKRAVLEAMAQALRAQAPAILGRMQPMSMPRARKAFPRR